MLACGIATFIGAPLAGTSNPFEWLLSRTSMKHSRTPEREVRGSRPTAAVLCPWARHFTPRKYWLITQEAMAPSRHDWKIVDWDVKPQHNQPTMKHSYKGDDYSDTVSSVSSLSFLLPDTTFIYREILKYVRDVWPRTVLCWQWNKYWTQCCILIMSDCAKRYTSTVFCFKILILDVNSFEFFSVLSYASMIVDITYQDLGLYGFQIIRIHFCTFRLALWHHKELWRVFHLHRSRTGSCWGYSLHYSLYKTWET